MSALRKPEYLAAGNKMAYLRSRAAHLTGDEFKALFMMVDHLGVKGCFPSQETLAREVGYSQTKLRRVRDSLAAKGEIGFVAGGGRERSYYSIPGLAATRAKPCPEVASRVPETPVEGAAQDGTEPCNPSSNGEEGERVLKIVPTKGWAALEARAPDAIRTHWLPKVELVGEEEGALRLRAANSLTVERISKMLKEGELRDLALSVGIDPEKVTVEGPARGEARSYPPTVPLSRAGQDEMADRLEARGDTPIERLAGGPTGSNVTSMAAFRTRGTAPPKE